MAELLEKTRSSYFPAFKKIFKDVVAGMQSLNRYFLLKIVGLVGGRRLEKVNFGCSNLQCVFSSSETIKLL